MEKVYKYIFLSDFVGAHVIDACHEGGDYGDIKVWF
jgi:hypothetical protein